MRCYVHEQLLSQLPEGGGVYLGGHIFFRGSDK